MCHSVRWSKEELLFSQAVLLIQIGCHLLRENLSPIISHNYIAVAGKVGLVLPKTKLGLLSRWSIRRGCNRRRQIIPGLLLRVSRLVTAALGLDQKGSRLVTRAGSMGEHLGGDPLVGGYDTREIFGRHWTFFTDSDGEVLGFEVAVIMLFIDGVLKLLLLELIFNVKLSTLVPLLEICNALAQALVVFFRYLVVHHLYLLLLSREIDLVVLLSLNSPRHLNFSSIVTNVGVSLKLGIESCRIHIFFYAVNDANNLVDIPLKFLPLLQAGHRNEIGFLVGYGVQVATGSLLRRRLRLVF